MAQVLGFLSVFAQGLSTIFASPESFAKPSPKGTTVTIAAALDMPGGISNAGGDFPAVRLYNEAHAEIGSKTKKLGGVGNGATDSNFIEHKNGQQASYALFTAGNDAICIAYVTITWANGDKYAWTGDWAGPDGCKNDWYYSNVFIEGGGKEKKDKSTCLWIDRNGDRELTGFHVHFPAFVAPDGGTDLKDKKVSDFCDSDAYRVYKDKDLKAIKFGRKRRRGLNGVASESLTARGEPVQNDLPKNVTNPAQHNGRLIVTDNKSHEVKALCESKSSKGPDMVNTAEGLFCRMTDHTLWPVCKGTKKDNCFNTAAKKLVIGGKSTRSSPYTEVGDWTKHSS